MRLKARSGVTLPPTRNHHQLARWINAHKLVDDRGRAVVARVDRVRTSTDSRVAGTRFRRVGRGRQGLVLEIWLADASSLGPVAKLYRHESSETYRHHGEARAWIEQHLWRA